MSTLEATGSGVSSFPVRRGAGFAALPHRRLVVVAVATATAMLLAEVLVVLAALDGHFVYTLDDPYIHLALARQIAQGHYGLAPGVAAAPSSSIAYPFLLAALLRAGLGQGAPLAVNAASTLASVGLMAVLAGDAVPGLARLRAVPLVALTVLTVTGLNLVGVAMTGMEHGLQVALTLAWLLGASRFLRTGRIEAWWWAAAALQPLLRYEGATLWLATVVLLLMRRRILAGCGLAAVGAAGLAAFSLFLHAWGLPYLPSSILVKSAAFDGDGLRVPSGSAAYLALKLAGNVATPDGMLLLAAMPGLAVLAARGWRSAGRDRRTVAILAAVALAVGGAQLLGGRADGFSRYAIYALALDAAVLLMGFSADLRAFGSWPAGRKAVAGAAAVAVLLPLSLHVHRSVRADLAARNIYEQQFQMHRLAADIYRAPVAANDIGLVSLDNPWPVLDLWGLGSEEARLARLGDPTDRWMRDLVQRHGVGLAMIYAEAFAAVPADWSPRGALHLGGPLESAAGRVVTLYATAPDRVAAVDAALDRWAPTLPAGVVLDRDPAPLRRAADSR